MRSSFPSNIPRFLTPAAGVMLFFFTAIWLASLFNLHEGQLDIDIVLSPPSRLTQGESPEIALYALQRNPPLPVAGLQLELSLRPLNCQKTLLNRIPAIEKRPGLFTVKLRIPDTLQDGTYELAVYKSGACRRPLAVFPIRVGKAVALAAVPPAKPVRAGDTAWFDLAAIDPVTTHPLPRIPIRCRVTTPAGFMTINRPVFTAIDGTARFNFSLHPASPAGEYAFEFSCGRRSILFRLSVGPALPLFDSLQEKFSDFAEHLPIPLATLLSATPPKSDKTPSWRLRTAKQPRSAILWARAGSKTIRSNFQLEGTRMGIIEVWQQGRLIHSTSCTKASGTIEITFSNRLPGNAPLKIRLWQKKRRQIWSDEYLIPALSSSGESASHRLFQNVAANCYPAPGPILARLLSPPASTIQVGGGTQRTDTILILIGFLAEASLLFLPWLLGTGFVLSFFARFCSPQGKASCVAASEFLVPISATTWAFFWLVLRSADHLDPPAPILLFFAFFLGELAIRTKTFSEISRTGITVIHTGFLLSGVLFLHMLLGGCLAAASLPMNILIIVCLSAFLSFSLLAATGYVNLNTPEEPCLAFATSTAQKIMDLLTKGGWISSVIYTVILLFSFAGILRLHSFVSPAASSLHDQQPQRTWKQKNMQLLREPVLQFLPAGQPALAPDTVEPKQAMPPDVPRVIRSRFLILTGPQTWTGRRIQKITVFTHRHEFLDRWIDSISSLRPAIWTICLELCARSARYQLLEPVYRPAEQERLEACLVVLGHMLAGEVQSGKTLTPARRTLLLDTLDIVSKALFTDPAFRQAVMALPTIASSVESHEPLTHLPDNAGATSPVRLLEAVSPALRTGGTLLLGSENGTSLSFPVRQETMILTRGSSFRDDFEIKRLEPGREMPLLLELDFIP